MFMAVFVFMVLCRCLGFGLLGGFFLVGCGRVSICTMQLQEVSVKRFFLGKVVFSCTEGSSCSKTNFSCLPVGSCKARLVVRPCLLSSSPFAMLAKVQGRD